MVLTVAVSQALVLKRAVLGTLLGPRLRSRPRPGERAVAVLRFGEWWAPRPGEIAVAVLRFLASGWPK